MKELEEELFYIIAEKANDLLSVEDLLKDTVVETVFTNIRRLLKIYILISSSEVVVERGFSKMGQMITKKRASLEDNSLEMLMRISHHKNPLSMDDVKKSFHCSIFSKFAFLLKYKLLQVYYGVQRWPFCSQKLKFFKQV